PMPRPARPALPQGLRRAARHRSTGRAGGHGLGRGGSARFRRLPAGASAPAGGRAHPAHDNLNGGPVVTRPSFDDAAERAVLGAALLAPQVIADLAGQLAPGDFYRPAHGLLWSVLLDRDQAGTVIDPITIAAHLTDTGQLT